MSDIHQKEPVFVLRDTHGIMKAKMPQSLAAKVVAADQGQWEDMASGVHRRIRVNKPSVIPLSSVPGGPEIRLYLWEGDTLSPEP